MITALNMSEYPVLSGLLGWVWNTYIAPIWYSFLLALAFLIIGILYFLVYKRNKKEIKENTSEKKLSQRLAEADEYKAIIREENRLAQIEGARKVADGTNEELKDSMGHPN